MWDSELGPGSLGTRNHGLTMTANQPVEVVAMVAGGASWGEASFSKAMLRAYLIKPKQIGS